MKKSKEVLERLTEEETKLNEKIYKLKEFIDGEKFEKFVDSGLERQLMKRQLTVMKEYSEILELRKNL